MIINIRWPHLRHTPKVMPHTITIHGASFVCTKCLDVDYYAWQTSLEVLRAKMYLTVKKTTSELKNMGLL